MFNPNSPDSIRQLASTLRTSKKEMGQAKKNRLKFIRETLGKHGPYHGTMARRHLNFLELAISIYRQSLVPYHPRCSLTARRKDAKPYAFSYELAINQVLGEDYVSDELETLVLEAMFSPLGILKIMVDSKDVVEIDGVQVTTGTPKIKAVTFDNWIQDMSAAGPNSVAFCGDQYQIDREEAMNGGVFDPEIVAKLQANDHKRPDDTDSQALREQNYWEDYRQLLTVWDVWLPDEGVLLTLPEDFDSTPPLRIAEWSGPRRGPYERMFFGPVPGNSLPQPPVALWFDLHETVNKLYNKCINQAEAQKTNDVFDASDKAISDLHKNAKDGDLLIANGFTKKETINSGGINNLTLAAALNAKEQFNLMSGNAFLLGGMQVASGTVGQDQMLNEGASQRLRNMQTRVRDLLRRVVKQVAEHLWESPLVDVPIEKQVAGRTVQSQWNRDIMPGEFPDYLIDIDPYSLGDRTPQERLQQLQAFWQNDVLPSLTIMQAQGSVPNFEGYLKQYAKLANLPEVTDLVTFMEGEMMPGEEQVSKPNTTTRKYERVSKSGGMSQRGAEQQFAEKLLSSSFGQNGAAK